MHHRTGRPAGTGHAAYRGLPANRAVRSGSGGSTVAPRGPGGQGQMPDEQRDTNRRSRTNRGYSTSAVAMSRTTSSLQFVLTVPRLILSAGPCDRPDLAVRRLIIG